MCKHHFCNESTDVTLTGPNVKDFGLGHHSYLHLFLLLRVMLLHPCDVYKQLNVMECFPKHLLYLDWHHISKFTPRLLHNL
ncbi:hypothetical protein FWK35_00007175, partial [Aphis craccivora]